MILDAGNILFVYVAPGLLGTATLIATVFLLTVLFFSLYLAYCTIRLAKDTGRLAQIPALPRGVCFAILGVAFTLDVLFNITVGTMLFLESPDIRGLTFTARCKKHMAENTWRGRIARWVCNGWLNPFEPGHC